MLKQQENTFVLTPFVVAYEEAPAPKTKASKAAKGAQKSGAHLSKEDATREVLSRIVDRVKKI
jgi:hypothetical protein